MITQLAADLRAARALVEKGWCQGESALDKNGCLAPLFDRDPPAYVCMGGACDRVAHQSLLSFVRVTRMHDAILRVIRADDIVEWNDHPKRTKRAVVAAFDRAIIIALAEKETTP